MNCPRTISPFAASTPPRELKKYNQNNCVSENFVLSPYVITAPVPVRSVSIPQDASSSSSSCAPFPTNEWENPNGIQGYEAKQDQNR